MVQAVGEDLVVIDLEEFGDRARTGAYLLLDDEPTLVETGSQACHPKLVAGLREAGVEPEALRHVIVTHVHLDHAGGAGALMELASRATLHCHPRAVRHLVDPSRLWQGAGTVYGEQLEPLFGRPRPVPSARIIAHEDGSTLRLGRRTLTFYDTPGHARHHVGIVDSLTGGLFSGDTVSIRYQPQLTGMPIPYLFPTTTPIDFDPAAVLATLDRLEQLSLSAVYHTHFSVTRPATEAFAATRRGIATIVALMEDLGPDAPVAEVERRLKAAVERDLRALGVASPNLDPMALDLNLNAQGIVVYLQRKALGKI
jgi:glyoxylase-like metal-dependent hydrolase (beta-lactamase superfamily II)